MNLLDGAIPRLEVVQEVITVLADRHIVAALGGSGLLAALGLTSQVRDWDLTSDGEPAAVQAALSASPLVYATVGAGEGGFATRARFCVDGPDHEVDLIVGFALREGEEIITLPTRVTGWWRGLPLGDPAVWALAYRLMGRHQQAMMLQAWLDQRQ